MSWTWEDDIRSEFQGDARLGRLTAIGSTMLAPHAFNPDVVIRFDYRYGLYHLGVEVNGKIERYTNGHCPSVLRKCFDEWLDFYKGPTLMWDAAGPHTIERERICASDEPFSKRREVETPGCPVQKVIFIIRARKSESGCDYRLDVEPARGGETVIATYHTEWWPNQGPQPLQRLNLGPSILSQLDVALSCLFQRFPNAQFVGTGEQKRLLDYSAHCAIRAENSPRANYGDMLS